MAEFKSNVIRPDSPNIIDHEQISVYAPKASADKMGVAKFDGNDFGIDSQGRVFNYSSRRNLELVAAPLFNPAADQNLGANRVSMIKLLDTEFMTIQTGEYGFDFRSPNGTLKLNRKNLSDNVSELPGLVALNMEDFKQLANSNNFMVTSILWPDAPLGDLNKTGFTLSPIDFASTDGVINIRHSRAQRPSFNANTFLANESFGQVKMDYQSNMRGDDGNPYMDPRFSGYWLFVDRNDNLAFNQERLAQTIGSLTGLDAIRPNYGMPWADPYLNDFTELDNINSPVASLPFSTVGIINEDGTTGSYNVIPDTQSTPRVASKRFYFTQDTAITLNFTSGMQVPDFIISIYGVNAATMIADTTSPSGYTFNADATYTEVPFSQNAVVPQFVVENYFDLQLMTARVELVINKVSVGLSKVQNLNPLEMPVSVAQRNRLLLDGSLVTIPGTSQGFYNIDAGVPTDYTLPSRTGSMKARIARAFQELDLITGTIVPPVIPSDISQLWQWSDTTGIPKTLNVNSVDIDGDNPDRTMLFNNDVMGLFINIPYVREGQFLHNWSSFSAFKTNPSLTNPGTPNGSMATFTPGRTDNGRLIRFWIGTKLQFSAEFGGSGAPDDVLWYITDDVNENAGITELDIDARVLLLRTEVMRGTGNAPLTSLNPLDSNYAADGGTYLYSPVNGKIAWTNVDLGSYIQETLNRTYNFTSGGVNSLTFDNRAFINTSNVITHGITGLQMFNTGRTIGGASATNVRLGIANSPYMTYDDMVLPVSVTNTNPRIRQWINTTDVYPVNMRNQSSSASILSGIISATIDTSINAVWNAINEMWGDLHTLSGSNIPALAGANNNDPHYNARPGVFAELSSIRAQLNRFPLFSGAAPTVPAQQPLLVNTDYILRSSSDGAVVGMKTFTEALSTANVLTIDTTAFTFTAADGETIFWNYAGANNGNGTNSIPINLNRALARVSMQKYFTGLNGTTPANLSTNSLKVVLSNTASMPASREVDTLYFCNGQIAFGTQLFGVQSSADVATSLAANPAAIQLLTTSMLSDASARSSMLTTLSGANGFTAAQLTTMLNRLPNV